MSIFDGAQNQVATVISRYTLGANDSFLQTTTSVRATSSALQNVGLWVGTGDDWVGIGGIDPNGGPSTSPDGPRKTLGTFNSQNAFQANDRYRDEDGERMDKFVTGEFVIHTVYGSQVVVTNTSPSRL